MSIATTKNLMVNDVHVGLATLVLLIPATILANMQLVDLNPHLYFTLTLTHSLSVNCLPYYLFGLLGFAFFHTTKGKKIALPVNLTGIALIATWIGSYFYYLGDEGSATLENLNNMIDTILYASFAVGSVPFIYFYIISKMVQPEESNT